MNYKFARAIVANVNQMIEGHVHLALIDADPAFHIANAANAELRDKWRAQVERAQSALTQWLQQPGVFENATGQGSGPTEEGRSVAMKPNTVPRRKPGH